MKTKDLFEQNISYNDAINLLVNSNMKAAYWTLKQPQLPQEEIINNIIELAVEHSHEDYESIVEAIRQLDPGQWIRTHRRHLIGIKRNLER